MWDRCSHALPAPAYHRPVCDLTRQGGGAHHNSLAQNEVLSAKRVLCAVIPRIHSLPEQSRLCQEQKEVDFGESLMKLTFCRWPLTPIDNTTPDRPEPRTTTDESHASSNAQRSMRLMMRQAARTEAGSRFLEGLEGVRSSTLKQAQVFSLASFL